MQIGYNLNDLPLIFFVGSMLIHLSQMVKVDTKDTEEIIVMVLAEMVVMMNLKMGNLVKMGKFSRAYLHTLGSSKTRLGVYKSILTFVFH